MGKDIYDLHHEAKQPLRCARISVDTPGSKPYFWTWGMNKKP
jgi:hypothetical protein